MTVSVTNWAGNHTYRAQEVVAPTDVDDLKRLVVGADRVRALGSRHSFNAICDTDGVLIDTTSLARPASVDETRGRVTVTPGVTFGDVAHALDGSAWALPNLGSLPHISVIGALATGTHGSGTANRILASAVGALRLMLGDGSTVEVRRGDDGFDGCVVALGRLGIVVAAELELVPVFDVVQTLDDAGQWTEVIDDVPGMLASAYSVSVFTRWGRGATEVLGKHLAPAFGCVDRRSPKQLSGLLPEGPGLTRRDEVVRWSSGLPHFRLEHTPSFGKEIQSEYFIPAEDTVDALRAVTALADVLDPHLIVSEVRSVAADDFWMSPAFGRDSTCLHFTWRRQPEEVDRVNADVAAALAPFAARPHWGKRFPHAAGHAHLYPRAADFRSLVLDADPTGKFSNALVDDAIGIVPATRRATRPIGLRTT
jgi:xylitol oxidase